MALKLDVNPNSLRLVREELQSTIDRAGTDFEAWLADLEASSYLESCVAELDQIAGTLRLLQLPGAAMLGDEMAAAIRGLAGSKAAPDDRLLGPLGQGFFVLPRYLDYLAGRQKALPLLLIDPINELRAARREPLVRESRFYNEPISTAGTPPAPPGSRPGGSADALRRFRHMVQVSLLALLQGKPARPNLLLLNRATQRIAQTMPPEANGGIWPLAAAVSECMREGGLSVNPQRLRVLMQVEKTLRAAANGKLPPEKPAEESVLLELRFLLMLSAWREGWVGELCSALHLPLLSPSDAELASERSALSGPGSDAIESVVKVLREELRNAKDVLEIGAQNDSIPEEEIEPLAGTLQRVKDTLAMVGLGGPATTLGEQLERIRGWKERADQLDRGDFMEVADTLLYVESSLWALRQREIRPEDLEQASVLARQQIIASSHLSQARHLVITEAQAGISMAKRAITSYVDSNFDPAHIANVATTLKTVWGGLAVIHLDRAAAVLSASTDFIQEHIRQSGQGGGQRHQLLETLADALISLEYYLSEHEAGSEPAADILKVAEDSLAALGHAVPAPAEA